MVTRARLASKRRRRRILWLSVVAAAVTLVIVVSALLIFPSSTGTAKLIGQPVSTTVYQELVGVSDSTLSAVGSGQGVSAPTSITGAPLLNGGKPEVFYMGGEFCPFCAVERWSMIIALSRFGNFTNLQYMLSGPPPEVYPNTPTFTFRGSQYSSQYISFVAVEQFGRGGQSDVKQPLTSDQQALVTQYDTQGSIPFIDIGNSYSVIGVQTKNAPDTILVGNWTQIASQLNNPSSTVASNVDAAANYLISAICKTDGGKPTNVCAQSYATLTVSYRPPMQGGAQQSFQSYAILPSEERRWTI
jgi:uncharacterized protein DUF929